MHAPDGFLNVGTALATAGLSAGAIAISLRHAKHELADRQVPLAGMAAAFIFAAQMVNFPVAAGTTGHLLGGALAAILLGPMVGAVVVGVVVLVQALIFADGGITALGYNVLNMAIVTSFGGYAAFRLALRALPPTRTAVAAAGGLAGGVSVVLSSMAFSVEWLFGATAPVSFDKVFGAMVGVHALIGIGEGVITGMALASILASRPDLIVGIKGYVLSSEPVAHVPRRVVIAAGVGVSIILATAVSQFSGSAPDGLERVAADAGISASGNPVFDSLLADYATDGLGNEAISLAVAGAAGVAVVGLVVLGLVAGARPARLIRRRSRQRVDASTPA